MLSTVYVARNAALVISRLELSGVWARVKKMEREREKKSKESEW